MRLLLMISLVPLLVACGPRVACDGESAQQLLTDVFNQGIKSRFDPGEASAETQQAVAAIRMTLAGLREVSREDGSCTGEGIASLHLREDVARRLTNDTAQYVFSDLGNPTLSGNTLRLPVQYTIAESANGLQAQSAALMDLAGGGVGFTLQIVSGQIAQGNSER